MRNFFFTDTTTTKIYTLSLHDALPICERAWPPAIHSPGCAGAAAAVDAAQSAEDRKSTRLNSSHPSISYAVFCLKKKISKIKQQILLIVYQLHRSRVLD